MFSTMRRVFNPYSSTTYISCYQIYQRKQLFTFAVRYHLVLSIRFKLPGFSYLSANSLNL